MANSKLPHVYVYLRADCCSVTKLFRFNTYTIHVLPSFILPCAAILLRATRDWTAFRSLASGSAEINETKHQLRLPAAAEL